MQGHPLMNTTRSISRRESVALALFPPSCGLSLSGSHGGRLERDARNGGRVVPIRLRQRSPTSAFLPSQSSIQLGLLISSLPQPNRQRPTTSSPTPLTQLSLRTPHLENHPRHDTPNSKETS